MTKKKSSSKKTTGARKSSSGRSNRRSDDSSSPIDNSENVNRADISNVERETDRDVAADDSPGTDGELSNRDRDDVGPV